MSEMSAVKIAVPVDEYSALTRGVGVVEGDAVPGHGRHLRDAVPHDAGAEDGDAFAPGGHAASPR